VHSEQADRFAHRRLYVQRLHILPVFLEQRDKEVDTQHNVREHLVVRHLNMTDGDTKAKHLLELELDR